MYVLWLPACTYHDELKLALNFAGENKGELQKVLRHYEGDTLKYRAACFLIENMPYHIFYEGKGLESYYRYFELAKGQKDEARLIVDSLNRRGGFNIDRLVRKSDIEELDSAYLVDNIDFAFKVWHEQPWGKNVCFEDFCEYILPYKIGDELPVRWRNYFYDKFNPVLDSLRRLPEADDPAVAAKVLFDSLVKYQVTYTGLIPYGPHVGPLIAELRTGSCREFSDLLIYVFRSVGIPCGEDFIVRGDNNANHFWNFVMSKSGKSFRMELSDSIFGPAEDLFNPKGKVYRHTYSLNRKMLNDIGKSVREIHPKFRIPKFIDVTSLYAGDLLSTLILPETYLYSKEKVKKSEVVYLCVSQWRDWIPIAWARYTHGEELKFSNLEGDIVGRLAYYQGGEMQFCSDPFLFKKDGCIKSFSSLGNDTVITLYHKHNLYSEPYAYRMEKGVFEGDNEKEFSHPDTLYYIKESPFRLFTTAYPPFSNKKYKYLRYKGSKDSYCNIAEVLFYEKAKDSLPIRGKVIGTPGSKSIGHEYMNVFDGNPYSSFDYIESSSGWSGLELSRMYSVEKIVYAPRNCDNFIRKGNCYELFYWKNHDWVSAGRQVADADSLLYQVPKGALLYLKCHAGGKDERIFEMVEGRQKFW